MKSSINIYLLAIAMSLLQGFELFAQPRDVININNNWMFKFQYVVSRDSGIRVNLPHTWNAVDGSIGKLDYFRGTGAYTKSIFIDSSYQSKRLFLYFKGAGTVVDVFVNNQHAGNHKGGFNAFCFEITEQILYNKHNSIVIKVNNAHDLNILPLEGDFVLYGGVYRPLELLVMNKICIDPLDNASPGVYVQQKASKENAMLNVKTRLSNKASASESIVVKTFVKNKEGIIVKQDNKSTIIAANQTDSLFQNIQLAKPHLWNGKHDPYLYTVTVLVYKKDILVDSVTQNIGLRYYAVDVNKGFLLNGQPYDLHGAARHESSLTNGNALTDEMQIADFELMNELGATAIRFTHYPYSQTAYDYCDSTGLIVWSEIPFVGPGGSLGSGFYNTVSLKENARQQLIEMIKQNYNHPSVCFWGLYNELENNSDALVPFLKELNAIAHIEDATRLTTAASNQDFKNDMNYATDVIAWNKYFGWYGHNVDSIGKWLDMLHQQKPTTSIGISEFGAGASLMQHDETLVQPAPKGKWHPEEWQTYFHENYWRQLSARTYVWCKFIWVMYDFYSAYRNEGDATGVNDKGIVSMDRKIKKDAFYFYKANWNPAPMVHIAEKRLLNRSIQAINIKAYTNIENAELFVNGKSYGTTVKELSTCIWKNVLLNKGQNNIKVIGKQNGVQYQDNCSWYYNQIL